MSRIVLELSKIPFNVSLTSGSSTVEKNLKAFSSFWSISGLIKFTKLFWVTISFRIKVKDLFSTLLGEV